MITEKKGGGNPVIFKIISGLKRLFSLFSGFGKDVHMVCTRCLQHWQQKLYWNVNSVTEYSKQIPVKTQIIHESYKKCIWYKSGSP